MCSTLANLVWKQKNSCVQELRKYIPYFHFFATENILKWITQAREKCGIEFFWK